MCIENLHSVQLYLARSLDELDLRGLLGGAAALSRGVSLGLSGLAQTTHRTGKIEKLESAIDGDLNRVK